MLCLVKTRIYADENGSGSAFDRCVLIPTQSTLFPVRAAQSPTITSTRRNRYRPVYNGPRELT